MTFTRNAALACALALTACARGGAASSPDDWRAALARGDGVSAEVALKHALRAGAPRAELASFLGEAELVQGDLVEARRWLGTAQFAPDVRAHGYHMLGRLRLREGDLAGAGQAFDQALRGQANNPELWVDIARLRYQGGEQAQAVEASRKALALGPDNPAALLLRAQLVRDARGNAVGLPLLERGLKAAPNDRDLLADYAATLGELGRASDMLAAVRRFAAAAPGDRRALYMQALLAARAGNADLARSLLQRSGDLDREMPAAILLLAVIDLDNGNPASAAQGFDRLLAKQPDNLRVQALLAQALAASGSDRELIARFGGRAEDRTIALLVGRAYENTGDRGSAASYLDRASRPGPPRVGRLASAGRLEAGRSPVDGSSAVALVRQQIAAGGAKSARIAARDWLRKQPGSADAMALAGDAAFAASDWKGALTFYRKAAAIRRPWPLVKRMAAALEATGDTSAAEHLVADFLSGEPNNAEAATLLAHRYAARGDRNRAELLAAHGG
jgi:predicted Zn-dependent protease